MRFQILTVEELEYFNQIYSGAMFRILEPPQYYDTINYSLVAEFVPNYMPESLRRRGFKHDTIGGEAYDTFQQLLTPAQRNALGWEVPYGYDIVFGLMYPHGRSTRLECHREGTATFAVT